MLDIKIINARIMDGLGGKAFDGEVGIKGERIAKIGDLKDMQAKTVIDAKGLVVCPGFIDTHTHSDLSVLYDPYCSSSLRDGCTTVVIGNCGIGVAPVAEDKKQLLLEYLSTRLIGSMPVKLELNWNTFEEYLQAVEDIKPAINIVPLLAHGAIRINEMGFDKSPATKEQIKNMKKEIGIAMEAGAFSMSTGLVYLPGAFTDTDELIEVTKAIKPYGGMYITHLRSESDELFEMLEEAFEIASKAEVPLHISHLKISGIKNRGKADQYLARLEEKRAEGLDISWDCYPYDAGMSALSSVLPPWCFEGGVSAMLERIKSREVRDRVIEDSRTGLPGWQNTASTLDNWHGIVIGSVKNEHSRWLEGKTLQEIADIMGKTAWDTLFDLLLMEDAKIQVLLRRMSEKDVVKIIQHPDSMFGSDGMTASEVGILSAGKVHPRFFGTHGRVFARYVRELGVLTTEDAVRRMTSMAAERFCIKDRGVVREGYYADLLVFDPDTIADTATFTDPKHYTVGINTVIVNGQIAFSDGKQHDVFVGKLIRKNKQ